MLLLFQSTHDVILAEKAIRQQGIHRRVIPVPRSVSSQCGMALEIAPEDKEKVIDLLESSVFPGGSANGNTLNKRYQIYTPADEK
jgi:hypothetical protein